MKRINFIGLGNMGGRMAARLDAHGFAIGGLDARAGLAEELGLERVASVAEACDADAVFLSLPSSREVEQVLEGPGGMLESARPGLIVVDMTTAEAGSTRRLYERARERGVALLDAPISGGPAPADAGTLTIMVGGDEEALARVRPALEVLGSTIHHLGASGNGHVAKAVNNFLNAVNLAASAEAMVLGVRCGLDPAQLREVINGSSGRNFATEVRFERILEGDYQEGALKTSLMEKDLGVYLGLIEAQEAPTFLARPALGVYALASEAGHGESPANRVVDVIGDLAGGVRMQPPESG
jgi:3-hydroxyisobutyrate dehydrogenase-like beta-hydroxyacid dehydrogenase